MLGAMRTKLTKRGQVSVPAVVRKRLRIEAGTILEWIVEGNTARIIPMPSDPIGAFRRSGKKGMVQRLLKDREADRVKLSR